MINDGSRISLSESEFKDLIQGSGYYTRHEIDWYDKFSRIGYVDPYTAVTSSREYLFITKPDLHIFKEGNPSVLNPQIQNSTFFNDMKNRYPDVLKQLQISHNGNNSPFMNLIFNATTSEADMPSISTTDIEGSSTIYGDNIPYRGSSIASDNNHEFSLEIGDTKYLELYMLFKTWDEYSRRKTMGSISPPNRSYVTNKKLHDQCCVYKIIVGEDGETILYFAKMWGVYPKGVPREVFSSLNKDGGLSYSVTFNATFVEDMDPIILSEFNNLVKKYLSSGSDSPLYNKKGGHINGKWTKMPYVVYKNDNILEPIPLYKLKWKE